MIFKSSGKWFIVKFSTASAGCKSSYNSSINCSSSVNVTHPLAVYKLHCLVWNITSGNPDVGSETNVQPSYEQNLFELLTFIKAVLLKEKSIL